MFFEDLSRGLGDILWYYNITKTYSNKASTANCSHTSAKICSSQLLEAVYVALLGSTNELNK